MTGLSDKIKFHLSRELYYLQIEDVKEAVKKLKESIITDDISIYDYKNQPNVQKAVEEQLDRIMNSIYEIFGELAEGEKALPSADTCYICHGKDLSGTKLSCPNCLNNKEKKP